MSKPNIADFSFVKRQNEVLVKPPGAVNGQQFIIEDLVGCTVYLLDLLGPVTVDNCSNCKFLIGPVDAACFFRNCTDCEVTVACQQLRTRDCHRCTIHLFAATNPAIESSSALTIGPWNGAYPHARAHFAKANFDVQANRWKSVYDFNQAEDSDTLPAPHWQAAPDSAFAVWEFAADAFNLGVNENPVPLPDGSMWTSSAAESDDGAQAAGTPEAPSETGGHDLAARKQHYHSMRLREFKALQATHDEATTRRWLERLLQISLDSTDLVEFLRDGVALCYCVNVVQPNSVPKVVRPKSASAPLSHFKMLENSRAFTEACRKLGLPASLIYEPLDLVETKNPHKVFATLCTLAMIGETMGRLRPEVSEPLSLVVKTSSDLPTDIAATAAAPSTDAAADTSAEAAASVDVLSSASPAAQFAMNESFGTDAVAAPVAGFSAAAETSADAAAGGFSTSADDFDAFADAPVTASPAASPAAVPAAAVPAAVVPSPVASPVPSPVAKPAASAGVFPDVGMSAFESSGSPAPAASQPTAGGLDFFDSAPSKPAEKVAAGGWSDSPQPVLGSDQFDSAFGAHAEPTHAYDFSDTSALRKWEVEHDQQLSEKAAAERKKKQDMRSSGQSAVDTFMAQRKAAIASQKAALRADQKEFIERRDRGAPGDNEWKRVCELINFNQPHERDIARQKSVLLILKSNPVPTDSKFLGMNL